MIINTEWGNYGRDDYGALPVTKYDRIIDKNSPNVGCQLYEKMLSGLYLGYISQLVIRNYIEDGTLSPRFKVDAFMVDKMFVSEYLSIIEA